MPTVPTSAAPNPRKPKYSTSKFRCVVRSSVKRSTGRPCFTALVSPSGKTAKLWRMYDELLPLIFNEVTIHVAACIVPLDLTPTVKSCSCTATVIDYEYSWKLLPTLRSRRELPCLVSETRNMKSGSCRQEDQSWARLSGPRAPKSSHAHGGTSSHLPYSSTV